MPGAAAMFQVGADVYDRWVGRYSAELAAGLIREAGVEPGLRVLDVGCGPGALTKALAAAVGAERVAAVDPSESFVAACRARVPGVDVRLAGAEQLPFADGAFDRALAQLVLNFLPDAGAGVRELARVTREGGRVAASVWDYGGEMTLMRAFWDSAAALGPAAATADERLMPYAREGELQSLFEGAGLREVRGGELRVSAAYGSLDDLLEPLAAGVGPAGAFYSRLGAPARARLREELRARLGLDDPSRPFRLSARAWYAVGVA